MTTHRIDWQVILLDLRRNYKPIAKIAREIGMCEKSLQDRARLGRGDMYYRHGAQIIELHRIHCAAK